jgi:hypothetical protein
MSREEVDRLSPPARAADLAAALVRVTLDRALADAVLAESRGRE